MNIKIEIDHNGNIMFMPKTKKQVEFMREWFKKHDNDLNKMEDVDATMCVPDKYVIDED